MGYDKDPKLVTRREPRDEETTPPSWIKEFFMEKLPGVLRDEGDEAGAVNRFEWLAQSPEPSSGDEKFGLKRTPLDAPRCTASEKVVTLNGAGYRQCGQEKDWVKGEWLCPMHDGARYG